MQPVKPADEAREVLHYMGLWNPKAPKTMARWEALLKGSEGGHIRVHVRVHAPTGEIRLRHKPLAAMTAVVGWVFEPELEADLAAHPTTHEALVAFREACLTTGTNGGTWTDILQSGWLSGGPPSQVRGYFPHSLWPALQGLRNRLGARILPAVDAVLGGL